MLSYCFFFSLEKGKHLICVVVLFNNIWICLLGWLISDLYFCAVFFYLFTGKSIFVPIFSVTSKFLSVWGSLNPIMYQSIPSLTIPSQAKPSGNFFDERIPQPPGQKGVQNPHPPGQKGVQNPHPRAYKNELNPPPPPGAFFSIIHYKNIKNETEIM